MVINVSVQYNGGFSPGIILLTLCDLKLGDPFNTTKSFCPYSQCSHLNLLIFFSLDAQKVWMRSDFAVHSGDTFPFSFFFNLTYSRRTSSLPSCLWSQRIFPSLPGSRLTIFYRDANSALLQLVNQWLNFTYSRSHAFRYETKNTNPTLVRIELTTSGLAGVQVTY